MTKPSRAKRMERFNKKQLLDLADNIGMKTGKDYETDNHKILLIRNILKFADKNGITVHALEEENDDAQKYEQKTPEKFAEEHDVIFENPKKEPDGEMGETEEIVDKRPEPTGNASKEYDQKLEEKKKKEEEKNKDIEKDNQEKSSDKKNKYEVLRNLKYAGKYHSEGDIVVIPPRDRDILALLKDDIVKPL